MGEKTWMLVFSDGEPVKKLSAYPQLDVQKTDELIARFFSNKKYQRIADGNLSFTCPANDVIYAGCFDDLGIIIAKALAVDYPSKMDKQFIRNADSATVYLHAMHSVVDWLAFAKWEDGFLVRSLSISPDSGVIEDIGERFSFEAPYWEGEHPATDPEDEAEGDVYPLDFHPLDLGEAALRAFFGFQLAGYEDKNLIDATKIRLLGYQQMKPKWKFW